MFYKMLCRVSLKKNYVTLISELPNLIVVMTFIVDFVLRLLQFWESFTMNVFLFLLYIIVVMSVKCEISVVESRQCDFIREKVISEVFKVSVFF